jgi:hypothetical protein
MPPVDLLPRTLDVLVLKAVARILSSRRPIPARIVLHNVTT